MAVTRRQMWRNSMERFCRATLVICLISRSKNLFSVLSSRGGRLVLVVTRVLFPYLLLCCVHASFGDDQVRLLTVENRGSAVSATAEQEWNPSGPDVDSVLADGLSGRYGEALAVGFRGSVYHPNLATYDVGAECGLRQRMDVASESLALDHAALGNLHLVVNWLKEKPYAFSTFVNAEGRGSLEAIESQALAYGAFGRWTNQAAPIYYSVERSSRETTGSSQAPSENALNLDVSVNASVADVDNRSRFGYSLYDFRRGSGDVRPMEGATDTVVVSNSLVFGGTGLKNTLSTSLYRVDLTGTENHRSLRVAQYLEMNLTPLIPNLLNRYDLDLIWTKDEGAELFSRRGSIHLKHQLYQSLTSSASVHVLDTAGTEHVEDRHGLGLNLRYRKNIGMGFLHLGYDLAHDRVERRSFSGRVRIVQEVCTLTDGVITFLANPHVDHLSTRVTDRNGVRRYLENVDYRVTASGISTQIIRMAAGNITNGGRVLVDYTAATSPSANHTALKQVGSVRADLLDGRLGAFYQMLTQGYREWEQTDGLILDTITDHTVGVSFDLVVLSGSAEYEYHNSSISPFSALRLRQDASLPILDSCLSLQSSQSFYHFNDAGEPQWFFDVVGQYDLPIGQSARFSLSSGYRADYSADPFSGPWNVKARYEFRKGLLFFKAEYAYEDARAPLDFDGNHLLSVELKRDL